VYKGTSNLQKKPFPGEHLYPWIFSFSSHIEVNRSGPESVRFEGPTASWTLQGLSHDIEMALRRGSTEEELRRFAGPSGLARLLLHLDELEKAGLLSRSVGGGHGGIMATWVPLVAGTGFDEHAKAGGELSRFAFLRRKAGRSLLESPLRSSRLVLYDWRATALFGAYPEDPKLLPESETQALLCLMANCGLTDGEKDPPLWDFHSLLFHSRSRAGRTLGPHGMVDPPRTMPELQMPTEGTVVALPRPNSEQMSDPAFLQVVENRRSWREHGERPIRLEQVSEFLWHTCREENGRRPYPCAGKAYELEVSLVVHRCDGLESGLYRYQPHSHTFLRLSTGSTGSLLQEARQACGATTTPQILILISARFAKMSSKYRFIAYSNILKDVGVLMQTMALTAAAMGLAACPLGTGDSDLFCRTFETEYALESSVGELTLGSLPKSAKESSESD
jgi:SagB-type dehydrogenase family enzyme